MGLKTSAFHSQAFSRSLNHLSCRHNLSTLQKSYIARKPAININRTKIARSLPVFKDTEHLFRCRSNDQPINNKQNKRLNPPLHHHSPRNQQTSLTFSHLPPLHRSRLRPKQSRNHVCHEENNPP